MRLRTEEIALYLIAFYLILTIVFSMNIFGSYFPGQRWNSTTNSLETYTADASTSIFGNQQDWNDTMAKYGYGNDTSLDASAIVDPLKIVAMLQYYITFFIDVFTLPMLNDILVPFIGVMWTNAIRFMMMLSLSLLIVRVVSGRLRWD